MNEVQINKIKKRADEYATSCFPYEKQFLEREAVVKCCVHVVTETIAELEKENKVLAQNLEDTEILNKTYEKRFDDLKKENAELKLKLEALEGQTPWKDIKDKSEVIGQLTNAKEIISEYVRLANLEKEDTVAIWQLYHKAEQFISEVEK